MALLASERVEVGGTEALVWGEGAYGVVMAHGAIYDAASWEELGRRIAGEDMVALAVEDTAPENLFAAADYLKDERGTTGIAFLGASAGGSAVLRALEDEPAAADQIILLSSTGDVSGLGSYPKLFVASEGEGFSGAVRDMAREAPGADNEVLILPGDAHAQEIFEAGAGDRLTRAILDRLAKHE